MSYRSLSLNQIRNKVQLTKEMKGKKRKEAELYLLEVYIKNIAERYSGIDGDIAKELYKIFEDK